MWPDDLILKKRPVNATQRLDAGSRVLFLSLRDVLGGPAGDGSVLLGCVCDLPQVVAPLLRAGRDNDAILVLSPGAQLAEARSLHRFFDLVRSAAEQVGTTRPIVVLSAPVKLVPGEADVSGDRIHALVDAGYTGISMLVEDIDPVETPRAIATVALAAMERELGVELLLAPGDEDEGGPIAGALSMLRARPDLFGVLGGGGAGLAALASEVEPLGTSFREGDDGGGLREALRNALGAGVRMVTVGSVFNRAVLESLPPEASERVRAGAASSGFGATDMLARELDELTGDALDRVEARVYGEAEDLLSLLRLIGSGRRLRELL